MYIRSISSPSVEVSRMVFVKAMMEASPRGEEFNVDVCGV